MNAAPTWRLENVGSKKQRERGRGKGMERLYVKGRKGEVVTDRREN